ncbi:MAG TPA: hypothetical protein VGQ13_09105 [Nitrososphaera sp.]|nr:hypothetical protein [Nitrososphaera sp.]
MSDWIRLLVKYKGKCAQCGNEISAGEYAVWSRTSKAIKHIKCEASGPENKEKISEVPELDCFLCGRPAGCAECGFEADCNRHAVSQACICNQCMEDKRAFQNYQQAFIEKARKLAKVKL